MRKREVLLGALCLLLLGSVGYLTYFLTPNNYKDAAALLPAGPGARVPSNPSPMVLGGAKLVADGRDAAPPPGPHEKEVKITRRSMLAFGCFLSILGFINPLTVYWSLSSGMADTIRFHSIYDLLATMCSSYAWLVFALTQLHTKDADYSGTATIVVNAVGFTMYVFYSIIKMSGNQNIRKRGCVGGIAVFCIPLFIAICFIIFGPIKPESAGARWLSYIAAFVQIFSQLLPFGTLYFICYPGEPAQPQHANARMLIMSSRFWNLALCLYWAVYCVSTYDHSPFEIANIASAVVALVSFALYFAHFMEPPVAAG